MSLARLAEDALEKYGEFTALAFEGRQYTNLDQQRAASRLAHVLRRLGVRPGDRVVVMLANCPEVMQSYGAILLCGAVIVPVIFLLGDKEVAHILADSEAKLTCCLRSTTCPVLAPLLATGASSACSIHLA
jgi:long-chain acyl-CoA synthetase